MFRAQFKDVSSSYVNFEDKLKGYSHQGIHANCELFFVINGEAEVIVEGYTFKVKPGDIVFIPLESYHHEKSLTKDKYERGTLRYPIRFMTKEFIKKTCWKPIVIRSNEVNKKFLADVEYLFINNDKNEERYEYLETRIPEYFVELNTVKNYDRGVCDEFIKPISRFIYNNLSEKLSLADISKETNYSVSYLIKRFKASMHTTLNAYINAKKIFVARDLIRQGQKAGDVALKLGYRTYSTFYREYFKVIGTYPSYRKPKKTKKNK